MSTMRRLGTIAVTYVLGTLALGAQAPDRATFAREEQRRFEILAAHWDVPLNRVNLDTRKPTR